MNNKFFLVANAATTFSLQDVDGNDIDGSAFTGGVGTYRLLNAGSFAATGTNRFSNVTITGFDAFASATLEYDDVLADVSLVLAHSSPYDEWADEFSLTNGPFRAHKGYAQKSSIRAIKAKMLSILE